MPSRAGCQKPPWGARELWAGQHLRLSSTASTVYASLCMSVYIILRHLFLKQYWANHAQRLRWLFWSWIPQMSKNVKRKENEQARGGPGHPSSRNPCKATAVAGAFLTHRLKCIRWLQSGVGLVKEFPHNDLLIVFWQPQHILQRTVKPELWRQHAICHEWAQGRAATCFPSALLPFSPADALGKLQVWLLANSSSSPRLLLQHSIRIMFKLLLDLMLQLH